MNSPSTLLALLRKLSDLLGQLSRTQPQPAPAPLPYPPVPIENSIPRLKLFAKAASFLGRDASPQDLAPDDLACAETVSDIIHSAFGDFPANGSTILSTAVLWQRLANHPKFKYVLDGLPGDIIVSPTGSGNGKLAHGHTGIFGDQGIMSNESATGIFKYNYTLASWVARYRAIGGFRIYIFRRVEM